MRRLWRRFFERDQLSKNRLEEIIIATAPASYWIRWGGDPEGLRKALSRR